MTSWIVLIYAVLVAVGGIMGYVKAHSTPSIIAGVLSGVILAGSALAMMKDSYQAGWWIALIVTLLLLGRFAYASLHQFKMMPGGMVIILSVIVLIVLLTNRGR